MKKLISYLLTFMLVIGVCPVMANADTTDTPTPWDGSVAESLSGEGTSDEPYLISNGAELAWLSKQVNGGTFYEGSYFKLTADIDLNNQQWVPIGHTKANGTAYSFKGTLDGDRHVIRNIKIDSSEWYRSFGFFGTIGGTVKNLGLEDMYARRSYTGTNEFSAMGGFVGTLSGGTIENCYLKNAEVHQAIRSKTAGNGFGGFCGNLYAGKILNSYIYNAKISCGLQQQFQGAFAGRIVNTETVKNCYAAEVVLDNYQGLSDKDGTTVDNDYAGKYAPLYGFGKKIYNSLMITMVDCYSTVQDANSKNSGQSYDASRSAGVAGATKAGIIANLNSSSKGYKVSSSINDGYPCLLWETTAETEKPAEKKYVVLAYSKVNNKLSLQIKEEVEGAKVYIVKYDNTGRYVDSQDLAPTVFNPVDERLKFDYPVVETTPTVTGDKLGVFVWDENLNPLAAQYFNVPPMLEYTVGGYRNGLSLGSGTDPERDAYAVTTTVNGSMALTSNGENKVHYIYFDADNSIAQTDRNLTFEITYLDTTSEKPLELVYNSVLPDGKTDGSYSNEIPDERDEAVSIARKTVQIAELKGTEEWKTAVVTVNDAQLRNSTWASGHDFGILVPSGSKDTIYIKSIKVIQSGFYVK